MSASQATHIISFAAYVLEGSSIDAYPTLVAQ